jgi:hypothetical protein
MPQTSVSLNPSRGADGQLNQAVPHFVESAICDEAAGIPFGRAVVLKTAATKEVDLPVSAAEVATSPGIALRLPTQATDSASYADGDCLSLCRMGVVYVQVEDAVTKGQKVFVRHTAGASLTALGRFRSDDGDEGSGPLAASRPGWEYLESGAAGEYVRVYLGGSAAGLAAKETVAVTLDIPAIETADEVYVAAPVSGRVVKVQSCTDAAITVADAVLGFEINGTAITGAGITVAFSGSTAGGVDEATPTDANVVAAGDTLSVTTDGGPTAGGLCRCTFIIEVD